MSLLAAALPYNPSYGGAFLPIGQNTTSLSLCEGCHKKPKRANYDYCSKTCGVRDLCEFCHKRRKFVDGAKKHPYCGRSCADSAMAATNSSSTPNSTTLSSTTNQTHSKPKTDCLRCHKVPKLSDSPFCGQVCEDAVGRNAPTIIDVPHDHSMFKNVQHQFQLGWRHSTRCPTVRKIYKIILRSDISQKYQQYRDDVEKAGNFKADPNLTAGNEKRRWHGTRKDCSLGDPNSTQGTALCNAPSCSLCNIIRESFNISQWGKNTGWGRFGKGIYTSATTSKANDYIHNTGHSDYRAVLLNNVVVGKGRKLRQDDPTLTQAPAGFDSVLGERGGSLNHDELVVYKGEAIKPSYVIVYDG
ncbi:ADP-ribosylation [Armillaria solidipes]|uniref:ADP-ribosylation n=1 Tax=Armillaria solidipes TaxID=1076256 RepID=A0A2H3CGL3_9AGAR|nr:ADP-ribosylation [Armillaria solidipes]